MKKLSKNMKNKKEKRTSMVDEMSLKKTKKKEREFIEKDERLGERG